MLAKYPHPETVFEETHEQLAHVLYQSLQCLMHFASLALFYSNEVGCVGGNAHINALNAILKIRYQQVGFCSVSFLRQEKLANSIFYQTWPILESLFPCQYEYSLLIYSYSLYPRSVCNTDEALMLIKYWDYGSNLMINSLKNWRSLESSQMQVVSGTRDSFTVACP